MANTFFIADTHFGHEATCTKFTRNDGSPLRPFADADEMDEHLVTKWNSVVRPQDKVYHLGDITMGRKGKALNIFYRLNGDKVLIKGNHDTLPIKNYLEHFRDIRAVHQFEGMILSHIPIHPDSLARWGHNIHGHTHANSMFVNSKLDNRYICVSVEQINYTPISLEEVRKIIKDQK